jgi:hypothetical protein
MPDSLADRLDQMGLPESGPAVQKQGVERAARVLGDGEGSGVGELVGAADDERVELVSGVEGGDR